MQNLSRYLGKYNQEELKALHQTAAVYIIESLGFPKGTIELSHESWIKEYAASIVRNASRYFTWGDADPLRAMLLPLHSFNKRLGYIYLLQDSAQPIVKLITIAGRRRNRLIAGRSLSKTCSYRHAESEIGYKKRPYY